MFKFLTRKQVLNAFFLLSTLSTACGSSSGAEGNAATPSMAITPYVTATQVVEQSETPQVAELPAASPTPLAYIVVANDTLLGIAQHYGVSLEALLAANPAVNPNFLSLGMEILVPQGQDGEVVVLAASTTLPMEVGQINCYSSAADELWCFLAVENQQDFAVENLVASIELFSANGELLDSAQAVSMLNLVSAGSASPLVAYWSAAPDDWDAVKGELLSAYEVLDFENRYISAALTGVAIDIVPDGLSASVNGELDLDSGVEASLVWILAVAYDKEERVVGIRRWEGTGSDADFELWVYSLGEVIERVDLQIEARP